MPAATGGSAPRGTETVLLVQPDPETRTLAAFMLARLGYTVLEAHHAMEALKIYDDRGGGVDLLLAELRMPRVTGRDLAETLGARDATLRVLFMADADAVSRAKRVDAQKHLPFLTRPFTQRMLADRVRDILDHPAGRPRVSAAGRSF